MREESVVERFGGWVRYYCWRWNGDSAQCRVLRVYVCVSLKKWNIKSKEKNLPQRGEAMGEREMLFEY